MWAPPLPRARPSHDGIRQHGRGFDLRAIKSPIVLSASMGDNITPLIALIKRLLDDERMRARNLTVEDRARVDAILAVLGNPPRRPLTKLPRSA